MSLQLHKFMEPEQPPAQPPAKRPRLIRQCCCKIIKNVVAATREEKNKGTLSFPLNNSTKRVVNMTGLSRSTIDKVLSDSDGFPPAAAKEIKDRSCDYTDDDIVRIRPAVMKLVKDKVVPTLDRIMQTLKADDAGWAFSRTTLAKALHSAGFVFDDKAYNYYDRVREDERNVLLRTAYLDRYFRWKAEGRPMVFMDESWINMNCKLKYCWHDRTKDTVDEVPPGKGKRWILIGAGGLIDAEPGTYGWSPNCFRMWKGSIKSEDYHSEMCADIFKDWCLNNWWPTLRPNGVGVIDRATYHLVLTELSKKASTSWNKAKIIQWLIDHEAKDETGVLYTAAALQARTKPQLMVLTQDIPLEKNYLIFEWLQEFNTAHGSDIKINILPIAHPQLNPIELLWGWTKRYVCANNTDFKMTTIETLVRERIAQLDHTYWQKAFDHAHKFAEEYWQMDEEAMEAAEGPAPEVDPDEEAEESASDEPDDSDEDDEDDEEGSVGDEQ